MSNELDGDQALIVVGRYDDIEFAGVGAEVKAIRRVRSSDTDALTRALAYGRRKKVGFLVAKHPVFSSMRIDRRNRNPALGEFEPLQLRIDKSNESQVVLGGNLRQSLAQGDMNRCQNNFEGRRKECHRIFRAASTFCETIVSAT